MQILLTEEQIERRVEKAVDRLDNQFMAGKISQLEYDTRMKAIRNWADEQDSWHNQKVRLLSKYYSKR